MSYETLAASVDALAAINNQLATEVIATQVASNEAKSVAQTSATNAAASAAESGAAAQTKVDVALASLASADGGSMVHLILPNGQAGTLQDLVGYLSASGRVSTTKFGVPTGSTSAVAKLQALIDLEVPIWIDGDHLIDKSLTIRNTDMIGPGKLNIVSDANFQVTVANFVYTDACIALPPSLPGQFKVNLKFRMEFRNSVAGKPHTPIRFIGLRDSTIDLDYEGWGSGDVTQTNFPDFYFWNNRVSIKGRYIVHQRQPDVSLGGFWVRDVYLGSDTSRITTSVIVEDGTYIEHDGKDEALSFFNPNNGTYRNCGVKAATLVSRKVGLSFLNFSGNSKVSTDCAGFAINTQVTLTAIGAGQAVVKSDYTAPEITNVKAFITGIDDVTVGSTLASAFRNSNSRSDGEYPKLTNCKAYINLPAQPTRELRAFDGPMVIQYAEYYAPGTAKFNYGVVSDGRGTVIGGRYTGALLFDISNVDRSVDCSPTLWETIKYTSLRCRRLETDVTPAANGTAQILHGLGVNPVYRGVSLINASTRSVHVTSSDINYLYIIIMNPTTGTADTSQTLRRVAWTVDG